MVYDAERQWGGKESERERERARKQALPGLTPTALANGGPETVDGVTASEEALWMIKTLKCKSPEGFLS